MAGKQVVSQSDLQQAILQVRSVLGCRVTVADGIVQEVHVLATADRSSKQVARDVETILTVQFGLQVDYRKISVAQLEEDDLRAQAKSCLKVRSLKTTVQGPTTRVEVYLENEGTVLSDSAEGPNTYVSRLRLTAEATLKAMEKHLGESCQLAVDDVVPFEVGRWEGILVAVSLWTVHGEESLVGSALVQNDILEAVVRATLDAVARRIIFTVDKPA